LHLCSTIRKEKDGFLVSNSFVKFENYFDQGKTVARRSTFYDYEYRIFSSKQFPTSTGMYVKLAPILIAMGLQR